MADRSHGEDAMIDTMIGPYRVLAKLGEGGMGEVWRARDTKLNRDVALKILPESFAADPDRLARFQREAQVLASLNHPNIAAIHGLEDSSAIHALVLELVEGPTLADRIAEGALPIDEALPIARQIAEALEAAHEQGIIHRDLKPANIKLRPDGTAKVLDFGLAKLIESDGPPKGGPHVPNDRSVRLLDRRSLGEGGQPDLTALPTITTPAMTMAGVILGTAAYMSPEQARGRRVDKRTDVWAFGCLLFEMLTGKRAFDGEDVTETIAAVVKSEPMWAALPSELPGQLRLLLRRCLDKDPRARLGEIATARFLITETLPPSEPSAEATATTASGVSHRTTRRRLALSAIAMLVIAGVSVLGTWAWTRRPEHTPQPVRFTIVPPPTQALSLSGALFDPDVAISPDGSHMIYKAVPGATQLFVRAIGELEARPLPGTIGARFPFVSPDGRWVGFFTRSAIMKVPISGGSPIVVCRLTRNGRGASWGEDDTIVFATDDITTGLLSVPAGGGEPTVLTRPFVKREDAIRFGVDHWYPSFLPGARAVLYTVIAADRATQDSGQIALLDLATKQSTTLIRAGGAARYVDSGHLVYASAGAVRAVRFDLSTRRVLGDPAPVLEQVLMGGTIGAADFDVSRTGTLVYVPGTVIGQSRSLAWVDRRGQEESIQAPHRAYTLLRLSPDGTHLALDIRDQQNDIWTWDVSRQILTQLTFDPATDRNPIWTPDSRHIVFASTRDGALSIYRQAADGTGSVDRLTAPSTGGSAFQIPMTTTHDGTRVIVNASGDLALVALKSPDTSTRRIEVLFQTPSATEDNAEISPDGRWLAYQSNQSGEPEIIVRPFPKVDDGQWHVSPNGGVKPLWAPNGRELFYVAPNNAFMSVPVMPSTTAFVWRNPVKLFDTPYFYAAPNRTYDVSPDGQRFVMIKDSAAREVPTAPASLVVVVNWSEELKQRAPAK